MPIYAEVEGVGRLEFPDGTDPAVIQQTVRKVISYQTPSQRRGENIEENLAKLPPSRNLLSSVAHGAVDTAGAFAQIASRGATALGLPPGTNAPFLASPDVVEDGLARARSQVDKRLGPTNASGMDLVRGASSGVLATPFMGAVGTGATMAGRTAQATRAGTIQGGLQPVSDARDDMDFLGKKTFQAGTGAVVSGLAQPGLEFGARGISSLAKAVTDRARGAVQNTSDDAAMLFATTTLAGQGIKFNELKKEVQESIVQDVREAMKKYGGVNAASLGRQADFKELGVDPLQPWVTRDPVEWGQYKNLEPSKDAGEPLIKAKAALVETLAERARALRGPGTGDAYQSGQMAERALTGAHNAAKSKIDFHYDAFRRLAPQAQADGKRMAEELFVELDQAMVGKFLPPELRETLNEMVLGKIPATPAVLHQLQKIASTEARKGGNQGMASGKVVGAIEREMDRFADEFSVVGPEMKDAAEALKQGRAAHRALKMKEESIPALKAVAEGKFAAEDFFNSYVKGADVREVAAMWSGIKNDEMKQAARSQLVEYFEKKLTGGADLGYRQLKDALDDPGMNQKVTIMLGSKGLDRLRTIQRAAENATKTPAGSRYNTSGTAAEIANLLKRASGVPFMGPIVTDPLQKMLAQHQAASMAKTGPGSIGRGLLDPFLEEALRRSQQGAGLLSPMAGGAVAGEFSR